MNKRVRTKKDIIATKETMIIDAILAKVTILQKEDTIMKETLIGMVLVSITFNVRIANSMVIIVEKIWIKRLKRKITTLIAPWKESQLFYLLVKKNANIFQTYGSLIQVQQTICVAKGSYSEIDDDVHGNVKFGDSSKVPMKGKGKILTSISSMCTMYQN